MDHLARDIPSLLMLLPHYIKECSEARLNLLTNITTLNDNNTSVQIANEVINS